MIWSPEASALLDGVGDASLAASVRLRAEKRAHRDKSATVTADHMRPFLGDGAVARSWTAAALARLARSGAAVETTTASDGAVESTDDTQADNESSDLADFEWTPEAEERMERVPEGFARTLTRQRIEALARRYNTTTITPALIEEKYAEWGRGSAKQEMTLAWADTALERINRIPGFVRGMVILEVERRAREMGRNTVTEAVIDRASSVWKESGVFHSEADPGLYKQPHGRRERRGRGN